MTCGKFIALMQRYEETSFFISFYVISCYLQCLTWIISLQWCQLRSRKENLLKLLDKMRNYQLDLLMMNPDAPIPDNVRLIKDDDIDR